MARRRIQPPFIRHEGLHSRVGASYGAEVTLTFILALCLTLPPINGPVVAEFTPSDRYDGHWGIDISAEPGSTVRAPDSGVVTFAGRVAGMRSVTIRTDDGLRVSLSYLSTISVSVGQRVAAGMAIGTSGLAHGEPGLHMSIRIGQTYVDPSVYIGCRSGTIRLLADR